MFTLFSIPPNLLFHFFALKTHHVVLLFDFLHLVYNEPPDQPILLWFQDACLTDIWIKISNNVNIIIYIYKLMNIDFYEINVNLKKQKEKQLSTFIHFLHVVNKLKTEIMYSGICWLFKGKKRLHWRVHNTIPCCCCYKGTESVTDLD